ncbi:protein RRP5 homolog isoform X2 [Coccinella septempunctata]|uniref:protein RRP5 homolog isoform X2 n=1 Tax=Coccinella septempunctata TaxID=41139 RepID=UPI001D05C54D|nr:protein RRP5 homolog isoform X2 [Coccinella septempunctata]
MDIFPRGGRKIHAIKRKAKNDTLFGNVPKKNKKEKFEKKTIKSAEENQITHIKMLSRETILEGMTLLACIKKITENALEIELPGLITGKVMIDSISDTLVETLKKALNDSKITSVCDVLKTFFHCGQFVPLKIKTIQTKDENCVILGSISPKDVNSDRFHNSFKKGELIWATVISELDHGYQLECGVTNCRIFLPIQHLEEGAKPEIGQPIWCKVHRVDTDNTASILRVGTKRQHIDSILTDDTIPLSSILPGTKVEVYVEKVVKNGIHCKFLENYTGFIHESQLDPVMRNINTIKESTVMCGYLLYVENITKIAHLSMRSLASMYELVFERGSKVFAEVIGRNEVGVYFKLNKNEKGWVSNKRILSTSRTNGNSNNFIKEKFPKGSKHQCVVLCYNHMDRVYICGVEKELLKEIYFSSKDLKVGDLVEGSIQEIKKNGVILSVGRVKGFIPNIHLTDVLYSEYLKKKFVVGKKIQARVYSSNEKSVIFTSKPSFLKEDTFFHDLKTVQLNQIYPALVLKAKVHGLVLSFFNNIEGYVPFKEYNFQVTQEYRDNPSAFFYSGQVIKVRVLSVKTDRIIATLKLEASSTLCRAKLAHNSHLSHFQVLKTKNLNIINKHDAGKNDTRTSEAPEIPGLPLCGQTSSPSRLCVERAVIHPLSSISNFFSAGTKKINEAESSSDDEEDEENLNKKQNKFKNRNVDQTQEIESIEHYDKLLMKNSNSSTLWLKYIAFCLSIQEFEKARNIGRRALASINMTCEDDKFNIWMTLLSIENLYGTKTGSDLEYLVLRRWS